MDVSQSASILEVRHLSTVFRNGGGLTKAVNDISFSLNVGETVGIVGESGSGKSVTALSIMRLIEPPAGKISQGEIFFYSGTAKGQDLLKLTEQEIRSIRGKQISMVFQDPMTSLNPVYTCGKQVSETLLYHGIVATTKEAHQRTLQWFEEVRLPRKEEIYNSYPHQLSGGQKQRVMIAMAMCCQPKILIADEPTTALDVTVQKTILDLMKELQKRYRMSVVFITHDLALIKGFADQVMVMYKGKIVENRKTDLIFSSPGHPYTKGLLKCRPTQGLRPKKLPTIEDFMVPGEGAFISVESKEERAERHKSIYSNKPILEIKGLGKTFHLGITYFKSTKTKHKVNAVDHVSFKVFPGETLGIVGESGCGKTTLGRTTLQLIKSSSGAVLYKERSLQELSPKQLRSLRRELQIIFQDPYSSLNPRIMVGAAIMEPMKVHKIFRTDWEREEKSRELLVRVGLEESMFYRYPHEFSGGQRQRICIARALSVNPELIICDESVSALDVSVQAHILNLLNELKREFGLTYIFISHDLSVVRFMADRVMVMKDGRIEEIDDADIIYQHPQSPYTTRLLEAIPEV
jgi:peptide/nickel transport system ATP-binding protein